MIGMNVHTGEYLGGLDHLRQSITDILTTRKGSRVMRREYGCDIWQWIDAPANHETFGRMYATIAEALDKWEPRFRLTQCNVESVDTQGRVSFFLQGDVIDIEGIVNQKNVHSLDDLHFLQTLRPQTTFNNNTSKSDVKTDNFGNMIWIIGEQPGVIDRIATLKHAPIKGTVKVHVNGQKLLPQDLTVTGHNVVLPYFLDVGEGLEVDYLAEIDQNLKIEDQMPYGSVIQFSGLRLN